MVKRARVKLCEKYWYISEEGKIHYCLDTDHILDKQRFEFGNYFYTEEEAKAALSLVCLILQKETIITEI